jgi:hypothetical protein
MICIIGIHILGAVAQVMDQGFLISIERDWVVVLSEAASLSLTKTSRTNDDGHETIKNTKDLSTNDEVDTVFSQWLSQTNVAMKQIDLCCKVAAPAVAGFLLPLLTVSTSQQ